LRKTNTNGVRERQKHLKTDGDTICISRRERRKEKGSRERKLAKRRGREANKHKERQTQEKRVEERR